ncbi:MAG: Mrp/NBP35 family ATP-binding protein [Actinomycetia bacterium]|nr:Mrp/NBP35 family ATP-binding protein [Actinomycetes bacterium]MCH9801320.1 Mrp/NBP35 family ATP-binding protein [Actinomycetes bacterium]
MTAVDREAIMSALATVDDPEIRRPITDLGMVGSVDIDGGRVEVTVLLTVSGCPLKTEIIQRVTAAVSTVPGVADVAVQLDVMSDEQRTALREQLRGPTKEIPFNRPGSLTKIFAVASGKGGVGKSSITVNLAVALAAKGQTVGLLDADIYGHSIPGMLGVDRPPTVVDGMLLPPEANGVRSISMLPFKPGGTAEPVAFRGPMLHRALEQFLTDVWWGDLDVLLLDLPPGTGDVAISTAQLLPTAELLVVTTPQQAAAEVAVRAGMLAQQTHQKLAGVIENMSAFPCPHCGEPTDLFGAGGGDTVASSLSQALGTEVPLLGRVPFDIRLREGGDGGKPLVSAASDSPAGAAIIGIADQLAAKKRGLAGMSLGVTPTGS